MRKKIDKATIITEQNKDPRCKQMIQYLEEDILPEEEKEVKRVVPSACDYAIMDGILYNLHQVSYGRNAKPSFRLVVPQSLKTAVMNMMHAAPQRAHPGIQ